MHWLFSWKKWLPFSPHSTNCSIEEVQSFLPALCFFISFTDLWRQGLQAAHCLCLCLLAAKKSLKVLQWGHLPCPEIKEQLGESATHLRSAQLSMTARSWPLTLLQSETRESAFPLGNCSFDCKHSKCILIFLRTKFMLVSSIYRRFNMELHWLNTLQTVFNLTRWQSSKLGTRWRKLKQRDLPNNLSKDIQLLSGIVGMNTSIYETPRLMVLVTTLHSSVSKYLHSENQTVIDLISGPKPSQVDNIKTKKPEHHLRWRPSSGSEVKGEGPRPWLPWIHSLLLYLFAVI